MFVDISIIFCRILNVFVDISIHFLKDPCVCRYHPKTPSLFLLDPCVCRYQLKTIPFSVVAQSRSLRGMNREPATARIGPSREPEEIGIS